MQLLEQYLIEERELIMQQRLVLRVIGRRDRLPDAVLREMHQTIAMSADNGGTNLVLAIDYGGRDELAQAAQQIAVAVQAGDLDPSSIDEDTISSQLYTTGLPDPDLMIRTGGEMRISNFLLWQLSYAELWVTQTAWPDFSRDEFLQALDDYAKRSRRFGGL